MQPKISIPKNSLSLLMAVFAGLLMAKMAPCQLVEEYKAGQPKDSNGLGQYHAADELLKRQPPDPRRVVFLGDSITYQWNLAQYFPGKPYVNRGIGGQTTPQMLVRMFQDVIELKPAALSILAGTNDIGQNYGPETLAMVEHNFQAITELAQMHGIKVILCLVTPDSDYTEHKWTAHRPPSDILKLNAWLRDYAAKVHAGLADYYSALVDEKGLLRQSYSDDGLHPNAKGYELMAPVAESAIEKALQ